MLAVNASHPVIGLPAQPYIDPDVYCQEQELIFDKGWIYAGHVSQFERDSCGDLLVTGAETGMVEVLHGPVFINAEAGNESLQKQAPELWAELKLLAPDLHELKFVHRTEALLESNWKVAIENFAECYHCEYLHRDLFTSIVDPQTYRIESFRKSQRHFSQAHRGEDKAYDFENGNEKKFVGWWMWPSFAFQSYPGGRVHFWKWTPLDVAHTRVTVDWFMPSENLADWERELIEHHARTTFAEDLPVVANVQRGLASRGYHPGPLMIDEPISQNSEHAVAAIQQLWREAMGSGYDRQ